MTWTDPTLRIYGAEIGGGTVDGEFAFPTGIEVEYETRTQEFYQSDNRIASALSALLEHTGEDSDGAGYRQELSLDIGGGVHAITLSARGYSGSPHRWGNSGDGGTPADATGEDVHAQMAVLDRYINNTTIDSENPAELEVGEYSESGRYGPLNVVLENPNMTFASTEQSSTFDLSLTFVETADLRRVLDAEELPSHG